MLVPDTLLSDHTQCEEEENPDQDWLHIPPVKRLVNSTETQATSMMSEWIVGETSAPPDK